MISIWWDSAACDVNEGDLYNSAADTDLNISGRSISPIIRLSKMRWKWSKHIMIERWRNKDVRWRSFLRWGTNAPQKILMIRFETKTWLMENQVKLSCSVRVHLEIRLQLFWRLLDQNQSRFDTRSSRWTQLHWKSFYWWTTLNYQQKIVCETGLTARIDHLEAIEIYEVQIV